MEVKKFAQALGIELTGAQLKGICQKTSKRSMAEYDRFDPVHFGDGGGIPKVQQHAHGESLWRPCVSRLIADAVAE